LLPALLIACSDAISPIPYDCLQGFPTAPDVIPSCLASTHRIDSTDRARAEEIIAAATALRDSFRADTGAVNFDGAAEITDALQHLGDFYGRALFDDSARFHRMLDHVLVTMDHVHGLLVDHDGLMFPDSTPWLSWHFYPGRGVFFQPVNTMLQVEWFVPSAGTSTDTILNMSERLYRYALWRDADGRRFPVWEYEFPWTSGGVNVDAPWVSGLAEGLGLALFAEAYKRTGDPLWRTRTYEILNALYVPWQDGGVLLPDTTHGYWWEEYQPSVQVWNGSAVTLLDVGYAAQVTGDPEIARLFSRGIDALKYYTPMYDTGSWTRYSRTGGYNSIAYHNVCVEILEAFYAQTADPWFKAVADRWRTYVPPAGVK
jgi:hypothetical protein